MTKGSHPDVHLLTLFACLIESFLVLFQVWLAKNDQLQNNKKQRQTNKKKKKQSETDPSHDVSSVPAQVSQLVHDVGQDPDHDVDDDVVGQDHEQDADDDDEDHDDVVH